MADATSVEQSDFARYFNRWVLLITLIFGVGGNAINMGVFSRPVFNHHVCSWYFFALAMNNFIYSVTMIPYRFLTNGLEIPWVMNSFSYCQGMSYFRIFCTALSHYFTVLAAIDRFCASSMNPRLRSFSSFQVLPWTLFGVVVFFALFATAGPIVVELNHTDGLSCTVRFTSLFNRCYLLLQFLLFVIVAPGLMSLFITLTIRNRRLLGDMSTAVSRCRRMEHHLTGMLILLVTTHLILSLTESIEYAILFQPSRFQPIVPIQSFTRVSIYLSYVLPIVWYLMVGREYRRELNKMIPLLARCSRHPQIDVAHDHEHRHPHGTHVPKH